MARIYKTMLNNTGESVHMVLFLTFQMYCELLYIGFNILSSPDGSVVKESTNNEGDMGSIPG